MSDVPNDRWTDVGCFRSVDYWRDGSFYVLGIAEVIFGLSDVSKILNAPA
jgi:hypothetical protein